MLAFHTANSSIRKRAISPRTSPQALTCSSIAPLFRCRGAFGSGLALLSRFPIIASHTHPYTLNGHPVLVHHGDWVVAKAAGCATLDVEGLGHLDVWVTHVSSISASQERE